MAKRTTRAEMILQEARRKVEIAEGNVQVSLLQLREHESSLIAYREVYASLVDLLTPTPRKSAPKSTSVVSAGRRSPRKASDVISKASTEGATGNATAADVCAVPNCGLGKDDLVHQPETADCHVFHATIKTRGAGV